MGKKPETKFKEKVLTRLRALPNSFFEKIQQVGLRGTPDILGCVTGQFIALELKAEDFEEADPLQTYKLEQIRAAQGYAKVVTPGNFEEVFELLWDLAHGEIDLEITVPKQEETKQ